MEAMEAIASNFTQDVLHAVFLSPQVRHQEINTSEHRCLLGTVLNDTLDKVVVDVREPNFGKRVQLKLPASSTYHEIVDGIIKVTGLPEGVFVLCQNGRAIDKSAAKMSVVVQSSLRVAHKKLRHTCQSQGLSWKALI